MTEQRKTRHLSAAPRKQRIAIHSSIDSAGVFLGAPTLETHRVSDEHFRYATLRRCGQKCIPADRECRNLKQTGERCSTKVDEHGHHGSTCECGGVVVRRHNCVRDLLVRRLPEHLGAATHEEQRSEEMIGGGRREARLDVAVTLPGVTTNYLDVAVTDAYSVNAGTELQRAQRPMAAEAAESVKRNKYQAHERMIPFIIEAHGRIGPAATRWLGKAYKGLPALKRQLLQEIAATVQSHTAAMALASAS